MPNYPLTATERRIVKKWLSLEDVKNKVYLRQIRRRIKLLDLDTVRSDVDLIERARALEEDST